MKYIILEKAKQVYVPAGVGHKAYTRLDPRTKKKSLLGVLQDILLNIGVLKREGKFTDKQRKYIRKRLKELEPQIKLMKEVKKRKAVVKAVKDIKRELATKRTAMKQERAWEKEYHKRAKDKPKAQIPDNILRGLKHLGYSQSDVNKMSLHEAKAIYWNEISKSQGGYGTARVSLIGLGTPGYGQFRHVRMGKQEKRRVARREAREKSEERRTNKEVFGDPLDE